MKVGELVVMKHVEGNLRGFTPYKSYEVIAGQGQRNLSESARKLGVFLNHSESSFNLIDDMGVVRFCSTAHFKKFNTEFGVFGR